jgi:hypothetical protein
MACNEFPEPNVSVVGLVLEEKLSAVCKRIPADWCELVQRTRLPGKRVVKLVPKRYAGSRRCEKMKTAMDKFMRITERVCQRSEGEQVGGYREI